MCDCVCVCVCVCVTVCETPVQTLSCMHIAGTDGSGRSIPSSPDGPASGERRPHLVGSAADVGAGTAQHGRSPDGNNSSLSPPVYQNSWFLSSFSSSVLVLICPCPAAGSFSQCVWVWVCICFGLNKILTCKVQGHIPQGKPAAAGFP